MGQNITVANLCWVKSLNTYDDIDDVPVDASSC